MQRFWQITIVAVDEIAEDGKFSLTKELIEESFRTNPLPQFLITSDVEALQVGCGFHIHPTPEDLQSHREKARMSMVVSNHMGSEPKKNGER